MLLEYNISYICAVHVCLSTYVILFDIHYIETIHSFDGGDIATKNHTCTHFFWLLLLQNGNGCIFNMNYNRSLY